MQSYVISENNALLSELCAGARNVASDVTAVVFGDGAAAAECGADHILTCPLEESGSPEDFAKAIAEEILKSDAACVLVGTCAVAPVSVAECRKTQCLLKHSSVRNHLFSYF